VGRLRGTDLPHGPARDAAEELGITAAFHPLAGRKPLFLTATPTVGRHSHVDVSLWFVLASDRDTELRPDPREYWGVDWFPLDRPQGWPADQFDPHMGRFARKLTTARNR
jgi:hypothetical protein